jgi:hypothetical protein
MKFKIVLDDDDSRRTWASVEECARSVESWPAWKRGETLRSEASPARPVTGEVGTRSMPTSEKRAGGDEGPW